MGIFFDGSVELFAIGFIAFCLFIALWSVFRQSKSQTSVPANITLEVHNYMEYLMQLPEQTRLTNLEQTVRSMDEQRYRMFLTAMQAKTQQLVLQVQLTEQQGSSRWGSDFESQMAQGIAEIPLGIGQAPNQQVVVARQRAGIALALFQYAQHFRQKGA